MNKRCTNSSCRRTFSTKAHGACPYCGKEYRFGYMWRIEGRMRDVSALFASELQGKKLMQIKVLRSADRSIPLKTVIKAVEAMWLKWPQLAKRKA